MTSNTRNWLVFGGSMLATLAAAAIYLGIAGVSDETVRLLLRITPRLAFPLLLLVFVARPLRQLVATPLTAALLKNRRLLGIAFAGIHTAHLLLILYRSRAVPDFDFQVANNLAGTFVYLVILVMFATSFDSTARALGPRNWRRLHTAGLYVLFVAFVDAFRPRAVDEILDVYGAFTALAVAALAVRVLAFVRRRASRQPGPA